MQPEVMWLALEEPAIEHLVVHELDDGSRRVESTIAGLMDGAPFTLRYAIDLDPGWRVRSLVAEVPNSWVRVELTSDGEGAWSTGNPDLDHELSGCVDVDIIATPFTNTLPIRRLGLQPGEAEVTDVVYLQVPSLEVSRRRQRYTCLSGRSWRFESLRGEETVFTADLDVDDDGLVIDYPGLFRRLHPVAGGN